MIKRPKKVPIISILRPSKYNQIGILVGKYTIWQPWHTRVRKKADVIKPNDE
jgi:hypothetical protein